MSGREKFAYNYLIFRYPTDYLLLLIPYIVSVFTILFYNYKFELSTLTFEELTMVKYRVIDTYLLAIKATSYTLVAFFMSYRWSAMLADASYGYWQTLGINKGRFFIQTGLKFVGLLYVSFLLGLITILYQNTISLDFMILLKLNFLVFANFTLFISIAIMLGNSIKNPELAALLFMGIIVVNYFFNVDNTTILHQIFNSDLHYASDLAWIAFLMAGILGVIINFITLRRHVSMDTDL